MTKGKQTQEEAVEAVEAPEAIEVAEEAADAAVAPLSRAESPLRAHPDNDKLDSVLHEWLMSHIAGGPIARQTECYNALWDALPALRTMLESGD